jgi:3-oxoacyl-[acyl-carrier protein] reductase
MNLNIKGKIAVVTAASRGSGKAVAEALAAEGVNLAICSRNKDAIEKTGESIRSKYKVEVLSLPCDIKNRKDIENFRLKTIERYGTVHILFTNSGGPPAGKILDFKTEDFRDAIELNLMSMIELVYSFIPYMIKQRWGRIIASTSISVKQPIDNIALSNVSRVGVIAFVKTLSREIGRYNITSNIIAPGYIKTERVENLIKNRMDKEKLSYKEAAMDIIKNIPLDRIGKPKEFGSLVAYLSSEAASYINGETILIDGGLYKGLF